MCKCNVLPPYIFMAWTGKSREGWVTLHIGGGERRKIKMKVMVAIDEGDNSIYALEWAVVHLADLLSSESEANQGGASSTLVHVQPPLNRYVNSGGGAVSDDANKFQKEKKAKFLASALQICKEKMIKAETMTMEGEPKDMICQAVEQRHVDLVIVGSRGLGPIKRAFLESVSDYCARNATCPVLIVQKPKAAEPGHLAKVHCKTN